MYRRVQEVSRPHNLAEWFHADDHRQAAILPSSGVAANGKPIFDWDEAAAQLTRSGNTWSPTLGGAIVVTYAFRATAPSNMPSGVSGFQQFNAAQIVSAEAALQLWADVANIVFVRVGSGVSGPGAYSNSASILFANYTTETDPASAFAFLPSPGATGSSNFAGDIWVDISEPANSIPVFGDFGPHVLAHEIGHAIGINHPGDYDGGSPTYAADAVYWQDARMFTVMSYFGSTNAGGVLPSLSWGPQYHDIAAAQRLYGANMSARTGDTTYGFNSNAGRALFDIGSATQGVTFSIWDAGGVDTLNLSGYLEDADIDLRPGSFSSAGPTSGQGPAKYNLSIAPGVIIENAVGGFGNDTLTGNDAANQLRGGPGDDVLFGGLSDDILIGDAGADTLNGGSGRDIASYSTSVAAVKVSLISPATNAGDAIGDVFNVDVEAIEGSAFGDTLQGDGGNNEFLGAVGDDFLSGEDGDDILRGDHGNDTLVGGLGADDNYGGGGTDLASYASAAGPVEVVLSNPSLNSGEAAGDTIRADIEMIAGSQFGDLLQGNAGANIFFGDAGDDTLLGGFGNDLLIGGAGADSLNGGNGFDIASYSSAASAVRVALWAPATNTGEATGDIIHYTIEVIEGSAFADNLQGNSAANIIRGGGGDDLILGGFGNDVLAGGAGADDMGGGDGFDVVSYSGSSIGLRIALWNPSLNSGDAAGDNIRADVEVVEGGSFNDTIEGSTSANNLRGGAGADLLYGGGGDDTLWGQSSDDTLSGGGGLDLFYYESGGGADVLADFAGGAGASDVIHLAGLGLQVDTFAEIIAAATEMGPDVVITFGSGQSLTLLNSTIAALDADDFIFT